MIAVLGAFDGFHRGHALLFEKARTSAESLKLPWGAVTFDPHPALFMNSLKTMLFTLRERELIRLYLGIPQIVSLRFDQELARLSPDGFWDMLQDCVELDGIVVGRDFRFGYRRTGDVALLWELCRKAGISFTAVDLLEYLGAKISSSMIRAHIELGQCDAAIRELGYPYFVWAEVVHGFGRGKTLGFPTANLNVHHTKLLPEEGVYATAVLVGDRWVAGALSVGRNPTFDDVPDVRVEVFLVDYEGDLYDESLLVFFLHRLRPQVKFKNTEMLTLQISADAERCRTIFAHSLKQNPGWYDGFRQSLATTLKTLGYR